MHSLQDDHTLIHRRLDRVLKAITHQLLSAIIKVLSHHDQMPVALGHGVQLLLQLRIQLRLLLRPPRSQCGRAMQLIDLRGSEGVEAQGYILACLDHLAHADPLIMQLANVLQGADAISPVHVAISVDQVLNAVA